MLLTSYALYTAGLVLMIPAFLALAELIGRERPGWAFWGVTIAVVGSAVRIFQEGISFLALQLVGVQGLETATNAVSATYGAWYVLQTLNGSDNLGWGLLAVGAYRARVLGWVCPRCRLHDHPLQRGPEGLRPQLPDRSRPAGRRAGPGGAASRRWPF